MDFLIIYMIIACGVYVTLNAFEYKYKIILSTLWIGVVLIVMMFFGALYFRNLRD